MGLFIFIFIVVIVLAVVIVFVLKNQNAEEELLPYRAKKYFFTRSEREFFLCLEENIDHNHYAIFPKVRLADFMEVTVRGQEYQSWFNRIKSKHVDFILWDSQNERVAVAFEVDGNSHNGQKAQERDAFVEDAYKATGIRLERIKVGTDFNSEIKRVLESLLTQSTPEPKQVPV